MATTHIPNAGHRWAQHGLNLLPELFASPIEEARLPPLPARAWLPLVAILVPPLVLTLLFSYPTQPHLHFNYASHSLVEGFCALMSLVVFYVLYQEFMNTGTCRLRVMAFGFLVQGMLDGFHSISPPHSELFVWFRGTAALFGAALIALSLRRHGLCRVVSAEELAKAKVEMISVAGATAAFGLVSLLLRDHLPGMVIGEKFTSGALVMMGLAGLFYFWAGRVFLRYYRRTGEQMLFVLAVAMLLFAESQWLAFFSDPWDEAWWIWHGIRTLVFVGILIGIAHEVVQAAKELQDSQRTLVESERLASLGEMAASIAHEIRNPLATLTSSVGLLRDSSLTEDEHRELTGIVEKEVNRINHIVSDTLAFAQSRAARLRMLNLHTVVREALQPLMSRHPGIVLDLRFPHDLPLVRGDEVQLQRIVWNLFDNAAAAMEGCGRLTITAHRKAEGVELSFEDTGPGIAPDIFDKIFKPFFSTRESGVGLGLPLVQRMVLEHEGRIDIDSMPGAGTRVRICLPAAFH